MPIVWWTQLVRYILLRNKCLQPDMIRPLMPRGSWTQFMAPLSQRSVSTQEMRHLVLINREFPWTRPTYWLSRTTAGCYKRPLVAMNTFWLLWTTAGCYKRPFVAMDYRGLLWTAADCYGLPLVAMDCSWLRWTTVGCYGRPLGAMDSSWHKAS